MPDLPIETFSPKIETTVEPDGYGAYTFNGFNDALNPPAPRVHLAGDWIYGVGHNDAIRPEPQLLSFRVRSSRVKGVQWLPGHRVLSFLRLGEPLGDLWEEFTRCFFLAKVQGSYGFAVVLVSC